MASLPYEKGMPASAKRVFHGEIYDIWQWPQQLFDGSMATFERASRPDVVEIIATTNRKIIMERQRQPDCKPFICLPSGRVEGNNPLANAKRELLEETG
ncbi:MAG: NUDIX domain-containing protein, partial [Candidatus Aenigmarchaeota archaeon]|nr:NUDIX domain-containing protein [Candidatus Aenigmarchaeota archaeon]